MQAAPMIAVAMITQHSSSVMILARIDFIVAPYMFSVVVLKFAAICLCYRYNIIKYIIIFVKNQWKLYNFAKYRNKTPCGSGKKAQKIANHKFSLAAHNIFRSARAAKCPAKMKAKQKRCRRLATRVSFLWRVAQTLFKIDCGLCGPVAV